MPVILTEDAVVVDSHVHIWRSLDIDKLSWQSPSNPLHGEYDLADFLCQLPSRDGFRGFVFVEADRKYTDLTSPSDDEEAWKDVLEEYEYVANLARQSLKNSQVLGIVAWAPVHLGRDALDRYRGKIEEVEERIFGHVLGQDSSVRRLFVGARYLLQDKPLGTCLKEEFLEGLRWLRENGLTFDLGVDVRSGGIEQLEEAVEMVKRVEGEPGSAGGRRGLRIVINHLTKPPLGTPDSTELYKKWLSLVEQLSKYPDIFVKFSGAFSELPELKQSDSIPYDEIVSLIKPYATPILDLFGPNRVIWGSDWPVCSVGYSKIAGKQEGSWEAWREVTTRFFDEYLKDKIAKEWEIIAGWNAIKFYGLQVCLS